MVVLSSNKINKKSNKCSKCNKQFFNLQQHYAIHEIIKKFHCNVCNYKSNFQSNLQLHIELKHNKRKLFTCSYCKKTFGTSQNMNLHKDAVHEGIKNFKCNECSSCFFSFSGLSNHRRIKHQLVVNLHSCIICLKKFETIRGLINHKFIHDENRIRNFKCDKCDKQFFSLSNLLGHHVSHTNITRFSCDHCPFKTKYKTSYNTHLDMHEKQKNYKFECKMQDGGTQLINGINDLKCGIRTETLRHMEYHIQRNHTEEGISLKFESEVKLANYFTEHEISFNQNWINMIHFSQCKNIEGNKVCARPDFFLPEFSAKLNAIVLVGNDEYAHRTYQCDFQRVWNIYQSLLQTDEFQNLPLVYIRFNPHFFKKNGHIVSFDLKVGHDLILKSLNNLTRENLKHGLNLIYIHYDITDNKLDIFYNSNDDYSKIFQDCVLFHV